MAQGPYSTHGWQPVPISTRRTRFADLVQTDSNDYGDGEVYGSGSVEGVRTVFQKMIRFIGLIFTLIGIVVAFVLAVVAMGYTVSSHELLEKIKEEVSHGTVVDASGCAVAPFPSTKNFPMPPPRVVPNPAPRKWRPFQAQWNCGMSHAPFLPSLLANSRNSFADEQNFTNHFIHYTDIVRTYSPTLERVAECQKVESQYPVGDGGTVRCTPLTAWGRACGPQETAASTANAASNRPAGSSTPTSTITTPCGTQWHSPAAREIMASDGHAYCARFCDGFASTQFFNVRQDGKRIACYCLKQCLGNDNPTVSAINKVAGSNQWDVWALEKEGFVPALLAEPAL